MNVPLGWLSDYVKLPKTEAQLTDRLTLVGHMLDKRKEVEGDVVIDLELRGNRADMFGMIGVARDLSAIFHTPLLLPEIAKLPPTNPKSPLVTGDPSIKDLVTRYIAVALEVAVGPSPEWLAKRLKAYGIEPINNVVDVTNYVMLETSHPMHAFDYDKITGGKLILRKAKKGEKFETIQQGTTLTLTPEDIAIADKNGVQCTTCIGGATTKVTDQTTTILLETAVYNAASSRRTARRHKVSTESGNRHEKHQDPHELPFTLARAVKLLEEIAHATVVGDVSDYYPHPVKPLSIDFRPHMVTRLAGVTIQTREIVSILTNLGFSVREQGATLKVTVPTFRTDVLEEADIVEEIIRIWGYDKVPVETLSGELPKVGTFPHIEFEETLRTTLVQLQLNEVITNTLIPNTSVQAFENEHTFLPTIPLINAPDPEIATLRPSLIPSLVSYAQRSRGFRQKRIAFFEVGKTYAQKEPKKYTERSMLGIIMGGENPASWAKKSTQITFFDIKGLIESTIAMLGRTIKVQQGGTHPSMGVMQATLTSGEMTVGHIGALATDNTLLIAEIDIQALRESPPVAVQPYAIAPMYPPIVEDLSFVVPDQFAVGPLLERLRLADDRIVNVTLLDVWENTRTIHITYADPTKNLTTGEIAPIRAQLIEIAKNEFGAVHKSA